MTRQAQVVRSSSRSGPASPRELGGGAVIHCLLNYCGQNWYGGGFAGGLDVTAADPYQRFFVSATIAEVYAFEPPDYANAVPKHVTLRSGGEFSSIYLETHRSFACLTGAIDLPGGFHTIEVFVWPETYGAAIRIGGMTMQCIEGQTLEAPGCAPPGGCPT
jgi:hypothetical protein